MNTRLRILCLVMVITGLLTATVMAVLSADDLTEAIYKAVSVWGVMVAFVGFMVLTWDFIVEHEK